MPSLPSLFELNTAAGHLIRRAHQLAVAQFGLSCGAFELTSVQFGVLTCIAQNEGLDQSRLAMHLALDAVTVGSVLQRLELKQLIERSVDSADKRRKCLRITAAAQTLLLAVSPLASSAQTEILSPLNQVEQTQFLALLDKLIQGLEAKHRALQT